MNVFVHEPQTKVPMHRHNCFELVYYMDGSGTTTIDGINYHYTKNTFSIMQPYSSHDEHHNERTELICVGFSLRETPQFHIANGLFHDRLHALVSIVREIQKEMLTREVHYELRLDMLVTDFVIGLKRMRSTKSMTDPFVYILNFINENAHQDIDLNALADIAGYSYHHFRHLFKERTGEPPMSYIINKRIEHASQLLLETDLAITTIAYECGFTNGSYFSSSFRKRMGMSPRQFRETRI